MYVFFPNGINNGYSIYQVIPAGYAVVGEYTGVVTKVSPGVVTKVSPSVVTTRITRGSNYIYITRGNNYIYHQG